MALICQIETSCLNKHSKIDKVRWIGSATQEELIENQQQFIEILKSTESDPSLQIATFRAFLRHRNASLVDYAKHFFFCENSRIAATAIEYAGELSPEWFVRVSGKLLQKRNLSVYRAAVRTLHRLSPDAGISAIRAMISSKQPAQIKSAVNCMVYLEFSAIRDLATEIASTTIDEEVFAAIIMLFQNNPESENLFSLYQIEKQQKIYDWAELARKIRCENEQMLRERQIIAKISVSTDEKILEKRFIKRKKKQPLKSFSESGFNLSALTEEIEDLAKKINIRLLIKLGFISSIIFLLFYALDTVNNSVSDTALYSPMLDKVEFVSCDEFEAIVRLPDKTEIIIKPANGKFQKKLLQDKFFWAELIPYRRRKGKTIALCTKLLY